MKHIHKYIRIRMGPMKRIMYKCALVNCPHFLARELVVGRMSICWICANTFVMTMKSASLKKPHCPGCRAQGEQKGIAHVSLTG